MGFKGFFQGLRERFKGADLKLGVANIKFGPKDVAPLSESAQQVRALIDNHANQMHQIFEAVTASPGSEMALLREGYVHRISADLQGNIVNRVHQQGSDSQMYTAFTLSADQGAINFVEATEVLDQNGTAHVLQRDDADDGPIAAYG